MIKLQMAHTQLRAQIGDTHRAWAQAGLRRMPSIRRTATAGPGLFSCPMHPQIRQNGPGNCPICGMTLEPVVGS